MRIFCRVSQGHTPVLKADVVAIIESPDDQYKVTLTDTGEGIDAVANDGVYTAMFVRYTTDGRFTVSVQVSNDNDESILVIPVKYRRNGLQGLCKYNNQGCVLSGLNLV